METITKEEALKKAKKYAKEEGYTLEAYAGTTNEIVGFKSYVWWVDDPEFAGQMVGLPLYVSVDEFGHIYSDRDLLQDLTGGDELEDEDE